MNKKFRINVIYVFAVVLGLCLPLTVKAQSETVAEIAVEAGEYDRMDVPVTAPLNGIRINQIGMELQLIETTGGNATLVTSQLKAGNPVQLAWILGGETEAGTTRTFELRLVEEMVADDEMGGGVLVNDTGDDLEITIGGSPVLNYRYTPMPVPEGVSHTYSRGGFIHPLWTPGGQVVTRIQPPDHYHHYGVWNPWTHVSYRGREDIYDFWNIGSNNPNYRQRATTRSAGVLERFSGEVFGGFRSELNYIVRDLPDNISRGEELALVEQLEVDVWNADPENSMWLIDFTSTYNPPADNDFKVVAYRYQGFSIRATQDWNDDTATLLTSEGFEKTNGNGTRARWVNVEGESSTTEGESGFLMMTNPVNFDYPEHIRIWTSGDVFVNYNPAYYEPPQGSNAEGELTDLFEFGKTTTLKYRMMLYDGELSTEEAERHWRDFAHPPLVDVTPVSGM